jgi:phospholipase D1/2
VTRASATPIHPPPARPIIVPGKTAWRVAHAGRVAVLVDGDAYFKALAEAMLAAERSIFIVAWDIDSRLPFGDGCDGMPRTLGPFLDELARRRPKLHVRILSWDFSFVYLLEREPLPSVQLGLRTHRRVHFELDGEHPTFAAHHQKIVVIDDAVAFSGGLDLCDHRWDTPEHDAHSPVRLTLRKEPYPPFHDVQVMVDGEAASALGELARERWRRAVGERVPSMRTSGERWPRSVPVDLHDVQVAIARTDPPYQERREVREIEALYLAGIAAARRSIYIENQYLTSSLILEALAARLADPYGPEIVILGPPCGDGWIENQTLGSAHKLTLEALRAADQHGHLRLLCAVVPNGGSKPVFIHSKIFVVDDRLLQVGSANLTNRSLGVDTECDLAIEADQPETADEIARAHARLLSEHLGTTLGETLAALRAGELIALVDRRMDAARGVRPVTDASLEPAAPTVMVFADPERPVTPQQAIDALAPPEMQARGRGPYLRLALFIAALLLVTIAWRLTRLSELVRLDVIVAWADTWRRHPLAPVAALVCFIGAAAVFVPINLLILSTIVVLGPGRGALTAILGALGAASVGYAAGALLGASSVRSIDARIFARIRRRLSGGDFFPMLALRLLPVAPAQLVSMAAGAFQVQRKSFFSATALGILPGVAALSLFGEGLIAVLRRPGPRPLLFLVASAAVLLGALLFVRSFLRRRVGAVP